MRASATSCSRWREYGCIESVMHPLRTHTSNAKYMCTASLRHRMRISAYSHAFGKSAGKRCDLIA